MDTDPKRRTFLTVAAASGCAIAGIAAVPALSVVTAPLREPSEGGARFVVGRLDDFERGKPRKLTLIGDEVDAWNRAAHRKVGAVFIERVGERELRAFTAICPHLGCSVDLVSEAGKVVAYNCPCHDSNFALDGSKSAGGPSPRGLDPLPVEIAEGGEVAVLYKRFRIGGEAREEV